MLKELILERKPVSEMSLDEIVQEIEELEEDLPRPFIQVVTKLIKSKGKFYTYAYLQWREGEKVRTKYLGKEIPPEISERIYLQNRYWNLKRELKRRFKVVVV